MGKLESSLNPFSKPVRPFDAMYGPDQIRGNDNQLGKALNTHLANDGVHLVTTTTTGVTTSAVQIYPAPTGQVFAAVGGDTGSGKAFVDLIAWHPTGAAVAVISSNSTKGVADARTYSFGTGNALKLQMAAGTYTIQVIPIPFN